jgi:drug/metabolite transporter (DMT)-like permease
MWAATLLIAPAVPFFPAAQAASPAVIGSVVALGVVCSGVAYLLYFRLIDDIGAAPGLTVTFLIPVFGIIWGYLFLNETIGWHTIAGSIVVIAGTALVTGFSLERLKSAPSQPPSRG